MNVDMPLPCKCGAAVCRGIIGRRDKKFCQKIHKTPAKDFLRCRSKAPNAGNAASKAKKAHKRTKSLYDNYCFCCGDGGLLIRCDRHKCTRVYHLECIGQKEVRLSVKCLHSMALLYRFHVASGGVHGITATTANAQLPLCALNAMTPGVQSIMMQ